MATVRECDKLEGMTDVEDMITIAGAIELANEKGEGFSPSYIARLARDGRITAKKFDFGKRSLWLIHEPSFIEWMKNRREPGRPKES